MTKTTLVEDPNTTVFWPQDSLEHPLIIQKREGNLVFHQDTDTIWVNRSYIRELIKTLKQYET